MYKNEPGGVNLFYRMRYGMGIVWNYLRYKATISDYFELRFFEKNSKEPITFWSGDKTLKSKVKDVTAYNLEMGMLYQKCAFAFMLSGICCLISLGFGIVMLVLDCTAGVYLMYRSYKRILERNS